MSDKCEPGLKVTRIFEFSKENQAAGKQPVPEVLDWGIGITVKDNRENKVHIHTCLLPREKMGISRGDMEPQTHT